MIALVSLVSFFAGMAFCGHLLRLVRFVRSRVHRYTDTVDLVNDPSDGIVGLRSRVRDITQDMIKINTAIDAVRSYQTANVEYLNRAFDRIKSLEFADSERTKEKEKNRKSAKAKGRG